MDDEWPQMRKKEGKIRNQERSRRGFSRKINCHVSCDREQNDSESSPPRAHDDQDVLGMLRKTNKHLLYSHC